jgi:chromosomal replication initiator protein
MTNPLTFARLVALPENRSALAAVEELLDQVKGAEQGVTPFVYLHGPAGSGKTALAQAVAESLGDEVCVVSARDLAGTDRDADELEKCALLIVEDLQHLPTRAVETLVQVIDARMQHGAPMLFTALTGPRHLSHRGSKFPTRLTSRLASGLVVALEPWQQPSRLLFLRELAERRKQEVPDGVLTWLAETLTAGGRQLEGALRQIDSLQRMLKRPLSLEDLRMHFRSQVDAQAPTVERIVEHVGDCFHVEPKQLRSPRRSRQLLVARQVSMYLARRLTSLSLQQIGTFFGGRDHTTVLHACRRVEEALQADAAFSGTVRRIYAELS